jgi:predicted metalloprotease with PDZ domain
VFVNFAQVLMYPVDGLRRPMTVRFKNRPPEWKTALELPEQEGVFRARHYDELVDAPAELSAFAETDFKLQGKRVRLVVDGEPDHYDMARLKTTAQKIASTAAEIMQDVPFPSYTFILHFREGGGGGMEHANSTAIDARAPCRDCDLAGIMAHEFFHLWNVKRIRPQSLEPIDYARENITPSLWFSEGVTSTYGSYIQLQAGLETPEAFLRRLAEQITGYERMPARLVQSAEESSIATWLRRYPAYGRPGRSVSYYLKGELAGYLLDLTIRHYSGNRRSLDDVLRSLNTESAPRGGFFEDTAAIERLASRAAGRDLKDFCDRVVRQAKPIEWDQYLGYAGFRLASSETTAPSLGVQMAQGPGQRAVVAEVDADGPAARAGLRLGDRLASINGRPIQGNLRQALEALGIKPGAELNLEVERRGRMLTVSATPEFVRQVRYRIEEKPGATRAEKAVRAGWLRVAPDRTKLQ